ncbi:MAG: DUF3341 domain-containing protein [Bacteroidetes bacterium]|nr:DUF3341 domain-containing protein [Bacteroidota bacterium]MCH8245078.1 DUF3341 domain-containing protein [Bacteroidota bacterium]
MLKQLIADIKASMSIYDSEKDESYGLLAEFPDPGALYHAAHGVREGGYRRYDTYSPFPIHGMDKAMGMGNSKVGFLTLGGGVFGFALAYWMQWWTGQVDYPINISGKPFFSIEPSIPIMFELTVFFAALATVVGMLALNGLPRPYNPLFYSNSFKRVTDDAFFILISSSDRKFDAEKTGSFLTELGATSIEEIHDHGSADA